MRLELVTPAGHEVILGLVGPGEAFGEAVLVAGPASAPGVAGPEPVRDRDPDPPGRGPPVLPSAVAFVDTLVAAIPPGSMALAPEVVEALARRLARAHESLANALTMDVRHRLAALLRWLAACRGVPENGGLDLRLRISQSELARMIGATRESVNRCLRRLAREGYVRMEERSIVVLVDSAHQGVFV